MSFVYLQFIQSYCHTDTYNANFIINGDFCLFLILVIGIHNLPDPIINEDGHYHSFDELYGTSTTEKDLPSASNTKQKKTIPFNATQ